MKQQGNLIVQSKEGSDKPEVHRRVHPLPEGLDSSVVLGLGCQTRYHRLDVWNYRNAFSYCSGGWEIYVQVASKVDFTLGPLLLAFVAFVHSPQSCPTLCNPMDCSMPGFLVLHHLLEFAQIHVHWISDAALTISFSATPSSLPFSFFQQQGLFI